MVRVLAKYIQDAFEIGRYTRMISIPKRAVGKASQFTAIKVIDRFVIEIISVYLPVSTTPCIYIVP